MCLYKKNKLEKFLGAILMMIHKYRAQGVFNIVSIRADKVFDSIKSKHKDELYNVTLTTCDTNHHVEIIERMNQFVKERISSCAFSYAVYHHPKNVLQLRWCTVLLSS